MDFTFGIVTDGNSDNYIKTIVESIRKQNIPVYEIIIVGNSLISGNDIINISFDESVKIGWHSKKKNIICEKARYENIVLLHDYVCFDKDWYTGFLKYGTDYDICVNRIETIQKTRFRDFLIFPNGIEPHFNRGALLPYDYEPSKYISRLMYISGTYYVIKRHLALKYPLNEEFSIKVAGEDVDLCHRLSDNSIIFKCNKYSSVYFLKHKDGVGWENEISKDNMELLSSFDNDDTSRLIFEYQKKIQKDFLLSRFNIKIN
jgi:hypothetical protein